MAASASLLQDDEVTLTLALEPEDLKLSFGHPRTVAVTPSTPANFLIDPTDGAASNHDRYMLRVNADKDTKVRKTFELVSALISVIFLLFKDTNAGKT